MLSNILITVFFSPLVLNQSNLNINISGIADMYETLGRFLKDLGLLSQVKKLTKFFIFLKSLAFVFCKIFLNYQNWENNFL